MTSNGATEQEVREALVGLTTNQRAALAELLAPTPLDADHEELWDVVTRLTPGQRRRVVSFARILRAPITEWVNPASDLVGPAFADEFSTALRLHHATQDHPLEKVRFENVLANAMRAEGHTVTLAPTRTTRFWDMELDGVTKISAKTSSAKGLKMDELHITKLSEAAWIQDVRRTRERHERVIEYFEDYLSIVGRSIYLRIFTRPDEYYYELVEVPRELFERMLVLPQNDFVSAGARVDVRNDEGVLLGQLVLDRSDSKITIAKIAKANCVVHAAWTVSRSTTGLTVT